MDYRLDPWWLPAVETRKQRRLLNQKRVLIVKHIVIDRAGTAIGWWTRTREHVTLVELDRPADLLFLQFEQFFVDTFECHSSRHRPMKPPRRKVCVEPVRGGDSFSETRERERSAIEKTTTIKFSLSMCVFSSCYSRRTRRQQCRRKKKKKRLRDKRLEANAQTRLGIGIRVPMGKKKKEWMREGAGVGVDDGDEDDDGIVDDVKRARERGKWRRRTKEKNIKFGCGAMNVRWSTRTERFDSSEQMFRTSIEGDPTQSKSTPRLSSARSNRRWVIEQHSLLHTVQSLADPSQAGNEAHTHEQIENHHQQ